MALFIPKDRKSLFRQFLTGMYDAVVITDPNGYILEINPRAEEYFGYIIDEVVDKPIGNLIPGLSEELVQRIRRGLAEQRHIVIDANCLSKLGHRFQSEVTISDIDLMDPDDLVFTIRNVERRRQVNDMLRAKESAFAICPVALFACDLDGRITECNTAFLEMMDIPTEEEARKHNVSDYMNDDPLPMQFKKAMEGEKSVTGIVAENEHGESTEIEVILAPNRQGRKIKGVVGSVQKLK
ncbi:MAG: PAS domain S-box protein [Kiritimatiellae bacterium]|nr:PAS domain S-box protein [Kiritimatiellia bacterium]